MPHLPRPHKKERPKQEKQWASGKQELYRSARWKRFSKQYRQNNPLCEASKFIEVLVDISPGSRKGATDHIIQVSEGGAEYDEANIMGLSTKMHNRKSNLERKGFFANIPYTRNHLGEKIPTPEGREMVLQILTQ